MYPGVQVTGHGARAAAPEPHYRRSGITVAAFVPDVGCLVQVNQASDASVFEVDWEPAVGCPSPGRQT